MQRLPATIAWHRDGLNPPAAVQGATAAYLANEDPVARWLEECCELSARLFGKTPQLYRNYCGWCEANHERPLTSKEFSPELDHRGYPIAHTEYGNVRPGIGLKERVAEGT